MLFCNLVMLWEWVSSVQFSPVAQSCRTLCNPMNHSMPGLPVHHQLPESIQTHVHWVSGATQPSHLLSSPLSCPQSFPASVQFSSGTQPCRTLCDPMNCRTPGFPVHHQLLELSQTHSHQVNDPIQPFYPLLSRSPTAFNLSQHQWVSSSHQVAKVLEFQLQHQSFQWFRTDFL